MSVPLLKRSNEELTVITKGRAFVARTIKVCGNEKYFSKRLRWDFTHKIPDLALDMFTKCLEANRVRVECKEEARLRLRYWKEALSSASALMGLIDLCVDVTSNMSLEKIQSWSSELDEVQRLIEGRIKSDKKRYIPYEG